ncbi:39S mitochondrial ribosomal protein L46-domain-containing protein [Jimgerdemannia flammicorona]|uniref:Large ribosomal subunit protein mL46 n=1 Tax=Jimgerdemannia flammicorona TaxID=994334 RepID=A0A433QRG7_9FUNG|nr:39S mitochondrial ribosomal protein L46-domain-containing protein [Jimgerdemannia flammicorona]
MYPRPHFATASARLLSNAAQARPLRKYTASAPPTTPLSTPPSTTVAPLRVPLIAKGYRIVAGVVLIRDPQIIRDPTPFERAYFAYQEKLARAAALPFPVGFYFKKGSVAERRWKEEEAARNQAMRSPLSIQDAVREAAELAQTDEERVQQQETKIEYADRITEADRVGDMKSLDRALQRSLYLVVKKPREQHAWQFPQGGVGTGELLHQAARRELLEECGPDMDVWFVGRTPIGHYKYIFPDDYVAKDPKAKGARVFFMKAHIFAGQVRPDNDEVVDYAWVTKQELKEYVSPDYYKAVKDMLSEL